MTSFHDKKLLCENLNSENRELEITFDDCELEKCLVGRVVVQDTIQQIRENAKESQIHFEDKEFLQRSAEALTDFGNVKNGTNGGVGIWRITEEALALLQVQCWTSDYYILCFFCQISKKKKIRLKTLLNPEISSNCFVLLKNKTVNIFYKISSTFYMV